MFVLFACINSVSMSRAVQCNCKYHFSIVSSVSVRPVNKTTLKLEKKKLDGILR